MNLQWVKKTGIWRGDLTNDTDFCVQIDNGNFALVDKY